MSTTYTVNKSIQLPTSRRVERSGKTFVMFSGEWTVHTIDKIIPTLYLEAMPVSTSAVFDLEEVNSLDTAGALVINKYASILSQKNVHITFHSTNKDFEELLKTGMPVKIPTAPSKKSENTFPLSSLYYIGKEVYSFAHFSTSLVSFFGEFITLLCTSLLKPFTLRWTSLFHFMEQVGFRAIPIVFLLSFLIGMVVAYMCMDELAKFGAQTLSIKLLEVSMFREMGILITAIVVAGRSSSSFTAQIGAMVSNEEVDAIRSMGLDPVPLLVLPRVLALILTLPMLVFIADVAGTLGGALAICPAQDLSFTGFLHQFYAGSKIWNFFVALIKAPFCALAIGIVGCYQGFQATSSSESVGFLTTVSVVQSIFFVIVIDAIFAIFFAGLGI